MRPHNDNADCCDICGASGWKETLVTCSICKENREHAYCMKFHTLKVPIYWVCEPCKSKSESTSPHKEDEGISSRTSEMHQTGKAVRVESVPEDEVMRSSPGPASCTTLTIWKPIVGFNPYPISYSNLPVSSTKVLGEHPRNDEIHKKTMTSKHASCPLSRGGIPCANADCSQSNVEKHDQSIQQSLNHDCEFLPSSDATWRGELRILHSASHSRFYDVFEARPSSIVNRKAYAFSREMPAVLELEPRPASNALSEIFGDDSPRLEDIALYFFPSEQTERLNVILRFMNREKSMLRSDINGVELLIFTSDQLGMDSKGAIAAINDGQFLWGLFRKKKIDKTIERVPKMEPTDQLLPVAPELEFYSNLDMPPGFE